MLLPPSVSPPPLNTVAINTCDTFANIVQAAVGCCEIDVGNISFFNDAYFSLGWAALTISKIGAFGK